MEKVVLSKEQSEKFARMLTEKPPKYWTIKQFLTYVNEKLKEPYIGEKTVGEDAGVDKYTLRKFYYDMRQLGVGISIGLTTNEAFCWSGNDLSRVFFCDKGDKFYVHCATAEGLYRLILRLHREWDFHCFVHNGNFYFCDLFEHSTTINPLGVPVIRKYKLDDYGKDVS